MVQESEEKTKLVSSGMTLLHKPFIESTPKTSKRSINFVESSSTQNIIEPSPQQVHELSFTTISIGEVQVDLFPNESSLKKTRSRYFSFFK